MVKMQRFDSDDASSGKKYLFYASVRALLIYDADKSGAITIFGIIRVSTAKKL